LRSDLASTLTVFNTAARKKVTFTYGGLVYLGKKILLVNLCRIVKMPDITPLVHLLRLFGSRLCIKGKFA
jgi:hypothetical protein